MTVKKVKFNFNENKKILEIFYDEGKSTNIKIDEENDEDLNSLYDFIIENIEIVEFEQNIEKEELNKKGVVGMAAQAIIDSIKEEYKKILEIKKDKSLDIEN